MDAKSKETGPDAATLFEKRRWIACLFTSIGYGEPHKAMNNPGKDSQERILGYTRDALEHLRVLLEEYGPTNFDEETNWQTDDDKPGDIWCCKFNSGAFGVNWDHTCYVLEEEFAGFERPWTVVTRVSDQGKRALR
jgi:ADP-ribose 1''-phosphate phosphatase